LKKIWLLSLILLLILLGCGKREKRILNSDLPAEKGVWEVYFNKSVNDPELANGNIALDQKLIERIDQAHHSIDACFYHLNLPDVAKALVEAKKRGVSVRFITEHDNAYEFEIAELRGNGIPVIDDSFGRNDGDGFMHNKFAVFDYRDETSAADDWVWTGSYNITENGTQRNANNVIEIQSTLLAQAYTQEFEEMWGAAADIPDSAKSRFHSRKKDNTPHRFKFNGSLIELYFCPSDGATEKIVKSIESADYSIRFSIFAFSRGSAALSIARALTQSGVNLAGVFDNYWNTDNSDWSEYPVMKSRYPSSVFLSRVEGGGILHHKYMLIDADSSDSGPIVITGSQNWTSGAEQLNDENTLIIHDAGIARQYLQEFIARYKEAGGNYPWP